MKLKNKQQGFIRVQGSLPAPIAANGFPRPISWTIGAGGQTQDWSQTTEGSNTATIAFHDLAMMNFPGGQTNAEKALAASTMRNWNPDIILGCYESAAEIGDPGQAEYTTYAPIMAQYFQPGTGGATDGDGWSRRPDGTITVSWENKLDINRCRSFQTLYNDPTYGPLYPYEYMIIQRYLEDNSPPENMNNDVCYWDIGNRFGRYPERLADIDRDGTAEGYAFDGSDPSNPWYGLDANYVRAFGIIEDIHFAATGKRLSHYRNTGSNFDWFDGANAHLGPFILRAEHQHPNQRSYTQGNEIENWGKQTGFETNGSDRVEPVNGFDRGFKILSRFRNYNESNPDPLTGYNLIGPQWHIDRALRTTNAQEFFRIHRYLAAITTMAGCCCNAEDLDHHRMSVLLDEFVFADIDSMTLAQQLAAKYPLGQAIGRFPNHPDDDAPGSIYIEGVQGGIISGSGIWCMRYEGGLVFVNPRNNGNDSCTVPIGTHRRFLGGQSPTINNGQLLGSTLSMNGATGLMVRTE